MNKPNILRKRFIPDETVDITGDELLFRSEEVLVTRWETIRKRADISSGVSFAFLNEGYKISRFYDGEGKFAYWYCDIIDVEYNPKTDTYKLIDLLLDVKITPDGDVKILDADELAEALMKGLITKEQACSSLIKLDKILKMVYQKEFPPEICLGYT